MADVTIYVKRVPNTTSIYLEDSEQHGVGSTTDNITTEIKKDQTVQWVASDGIASIQNITPKAGNTDLFSTDPSRANSWTGTVGDFAADTEEAYSIYYKVDGDDTTYNDDPRLKMKV